MTRHTAQRFKGRDLLSKHQNRHQFFIYLHIEPASSHTQTAINIKSTSKQQQSLDVAKRLFFYLPSLMMMFFSFLCDFRNSGRMKRKTSLGLVLLQCFSLSGIFEAVLVMITRIVIQLHSMECHFHESLYLRPHWRRLPSLLDSSLLRFQECLHK